jgi:hypothetical protein
MVEKSPHPRVVQFIEDCAQAGLSPDEVVMKRAGINRAVWYRWKAGTFAPNMNNLDAIHAALKAAADERQQSAA